jgi:hypothetical protein
VRFRISAALLAGVTLALTCGAGAAFASDLTVRPLSVAPAGKVHVEGTCPSPVGASYTTATVGIDALGRYAFVPVGTDGTFDATVTVKPMGSAEAPKIGDTVTVVASCRTAAAFVATVGAEKVRIIERTSTPSVTQAASSRSTSSATAAATATSSSSDNGDSVPASVPLIAFAVAVVGTLGAYGLSRRSDRRAAAMARHPAQRGVGRDAPRDRK